MKDRTELTGEQEAEARDLATRVNEAIATDVLRVCRLLVSTDTRHTFGLKYARRIIRLKRKQWQFQVEVERETSATRTPINQGWLDSSMHIPLCPLL